MSDNINVVVGQLVFKKDGTPFPDFPNAKSQQAIFSRRYVDTEIVETEGGFALKVLKLLPPPGERRKRAPLGRRSMLSVPESEKDPSYEYRFVNDGPRYENRIQDLEEVDWEVVQKPLKMEDEKVGATRLPGSATAKPVGGGMNAVLMRKRKAWYDEDTKEKLQAVKATEEGLVRMAQMDNLRPAEGYREGIKITHNKREEN